MASSGIVFDEVVGEVQPEAAPAPPSEKQPARTASPLSPHQIRRELARLAEREARLKAD